MTMQYHPELFRSMRAARWYEIPPPPPPDTRPEWRTPLVIEVDKLRRIMREVAWKYKISLGDLRGPGHKHPAIDARIEYYWRAAKETGRTICAIARAVNRNHTSVLSGLQVYAKQNNLPLPRKIKWWRRYE